jgi:hypothetical protein
MPFPQLLFLDLCIKTDVDIDRRSGEQELGKLPPINHGSPVSLPLSGCAIPGLSCNALVILPELSYLWRLWGIHARSSSRHVALLPDKRKILDPKEMEKASYLSKFLSKGLICDNGCPIPIAPE